MKRLQGTWLASFCKADGRELPEDKLSEVKFVFEGEECTIKTGPIIGSLDMKIDSSGKIKKIDMVDATEKGKNRHIYAIYKFVDDELYFCSSAPGSGDYPRGFSAEKGEEQALFVLKQKKR